MRFLMLSWRDPQNPRTGGAERVSQAYLQGLVGRGHEVFWFANAFPGCRESEDIDGIHFVRGGGRGTSILRVREWYRQQRPFDLVIDQHHGIAWFAPWWSRTNCIAYIHEVLGPIWSSFYKWPWNVIGKRQESFTHWLYRNVPFWTPSHSTERALHQHGVRQVKVIPNGTDTTPLPELEPKSMAAPIRLVAVSRLAPNKRVSHGILALRLLQQRGIEATLTIVGTGEVAAKLEQMVRDLNLAARVTMTGQVSEEEKNRHLRAAHLLVHTSVREGWGLNVIEANAMGTPAVVYPVGGLVDSTVNGETGIVTDREAPEAVAEAIAELAKDPEKYDRLRVNSWKRSKTFLWSEVLPLACDWLEAQARRQRG